MIACDHCGIVAKIGLSMKENLEINFYSFKKTSQVFKFRLSWPKYVKRTKFPDILSEFHYNYLYIVIEYELSVFFWGQKCNINCGSHGQCFYIFENPQCICTQGWSGRKCTEFKKPQPIGCKKGWKGKYCDQLDHCINTKCQNNGTCVSLLHTFNCWCGLRYTGRLCSEKRMNMAANVTVENNFTVVKVAPEQLYHPNRRLKTHLRVFPLDVLSIGAMMYVMCFTELYVFHHFELSNSLPVEQRPVQYGHLMATLTSKLLTLEGNRRLIQIRTAFGYKERDLSIPLKKNDVIFSISAKDGVLYLLTKIGILKFKISTASAILIRSFTVTQERRQKWPTNLASQLCLEDPFLVLKVPALFIIMHPNPEFCFLLNF